MNLVARRQCPICSGPPVAIGQSRTLNEDSALQVQLLSCAECGHWWHTPVPSQEELLALYREASPFVVTPNAKEQYEHKRHDDDFLGYMERFLRGAAARTYLEIGAGGGQMVQHFRSRGLTAYGVEPAGWNPQEGIVETIDDLPSGMRFDVVVLQDVLEHLWDPVAMLEIVRRHAAPDAWLFCSVPCSDSGPARRYGARWGMVVPFGHLHYFSKRSAGGALRLSGWEMLDARLSRTVPLWRLAMQVRLRETAYQLIKGGKDQLFFCARRAVSGDGVC